MSVINWKLNLRLLENAWVRSFAFRGDILLFRIHDFVNPLAQILIWEAVFRTRDTFGAYTHDTMLSYVLVSTVFFALSRNWLVHVVGDDIKEGRLNQYLVKPVSYISYNLWMGIGRTALATLFAVVAIAILTFFYRDAIYVPDATHFFLAVSVTAAGFFMNMLLSISLGFMAFWITTISGLDSAATWARSFLGGTMLPLDIVSPAFVHISLFLPFAYTGYVPTQIFLGNLTAFEGIRSLAVVLAWIVILSVVLKLQWHFGVKRYEGTGI